MPFRAYGSPVSLSLYDEQIGMTFTQNVTSLEYNVTAVEQTDPTLDTGPAYLVSGVSNAGYWYQVGVSWNWGPGEIPGTGFDMIYEVFDTFGNSIFPANGEGGVLAFSGPVNAGDVIILNLYFSNSSQSVAMLAEDANTGALANETYPSMGATYFVGLPDSVADQNGYFTGLMTEWYHGVPYFANEAEVIYSNSTLALSSAWMWMDEFNVQTFQGVFSATTPGPVSYGNPTQLQEFSFNGTTEYSDAYEFVTGSLPIPVPAISLSPSSGYVGTSVAISGSDLVASHNLTVTYDGSSAGMPTSCTTDQSGSINSGCAFTVPSSSALGNHTVTVSDGTNSPAATFTVTLLGVSCSKSAVVVGSVDTCKATVNESGTVAPTGTVTWSSSSSGTFSSASCRLSHARHASYSTCSVKFTSTAAGSSVTLTASYGGDPNNPATSGGYGLIVTPKTSKTTVSCSPASATAASSKTVTCKAKVTGYSPTGLVSWSQSGTGSVSLTSKKCILSQRTCSVTMTGATAGHAIISATYMGDSNNQGSSRTATLTIKKASTSTTLSCTQSSLDVGTNTTCTATVTGGYVSHTGTITFTVSGKGRVTFSSTACTLSSGSCSVTVTATASGRVEIKATYGGDSNNIKSSGTLALTIT
jgi:hypothetical protein